MNKNIMMMGVVTIVVAGAAFFGGMQYQKTQASTMGRQFVMSAGGTGGNRMMQQGQGMRPISGEILSQDDTSITVKMQDGSTKIIILSAKTTINKTTPGTKADLKKGENITTFGSTNADGSVTAQNVAIGRVMIRAPAQQNVDNAK